MPRKGQAYPIDNEWRRRVVERLAEMKIKRAELCRRAKISPAALSEALSAESNQTTLAPAIHRALGWDPPRPILLSNDTEEIIRIVGRLDAEGRARLLERAVMLEEQRKKH